ncbi:hypothetical protein [Nocardia noduli]|uniref:hypothetical protein n=1 Tax=Nocardia noduli TaxID=2815722 RepID=UPI001C229542|nr:hypothetical protein [Nocardia noduli]
MQISLPLLLTGTVSLGELEQFVKMARDLGAVAETQIEVQANEQYPEILEGLYLDSASLNTSVDTSVDDHPGPSWRTAPA